jgi:hypothetical protein
VLVVVVRVILVPLCSITIFTEGTAAFCGSVTRPSIEPVSWESKGSAAAIPNSAKAEKK